MRIGTKEIDFPLIQGGMGVGISLGNLEGHMAGGHLGFSSDELLNHTCKDNHVLLKDAPYCISRALIEAVRGNWEDGLFFTGQNGAIVDRIMPVAELIGQIRAEYDTACAGGI